jgi:hypothetical protein
VAEAYRMKEEVPWCYPRLINTFIS